MATERRLFIKRGFFSRTVTEIPYWHISYIEHTRRFPWKILVAGFLPTLILLLDPLWRTILQSAFVLTIEEWVNSIIRAIPQLGSPENLVILVAVIPMFLALGVFAVQSGAGFNVHGSRTKPIYLPRGLGEVITFIRGIQDRQVDVSVQTEKNRKKAELRL